MKRLLLCLVFMLLWGGQAMAGCGLTPNVFRNGLDWDNVVAEGSQFAVDCNSVGDWQRTTMSVPSQGTQQFTLTLSASNPSSVNSVWEIDTCDPTCTQLTTVTVPPTGASTTFQNATSGVFTLSAGNHVIRRFCQSNSSGFCGDVDFMQGAVGGSSTIQSVAVTPGGFNVPASPPTNVAQISCTVSSGSCAGATFSLGTNGSCAGAASAQNGNFTISGTGLNIAQAISSESQQKIGVVATLAGTTNSGTCFPVTLTMPEQVFDNAGAPWPILNVLNAANYDTGGQGFAYNITPSGGCAATPRADSANLKANPSVDAPSIPFVIGCTAVGYYYKFYVNSASAQTIFYQMSYANGDPAGGSWQFFVDGVSVGTAPTPPTDSGGFVALGTAVTPQFNVSAGNHIVEILAATGAGSPGDIHSIQGVVPGTQVACAVPAAAQAAGFTKLVYCADFSNQAQYGSATSPGSTNQANGWLGQRNDPNQHEFWQTGFGTKPIPPFTNIVPGAIDPATQVRTLKIHWDGSFCVNGCTDPINPQINANATAIANINRADEIGSGGSPHMSPMPPVNYYIEYTARADAPPSWGPQPSADQIALSSYIWDVNNVAGGFTPIELDPLNWASGGDSQIGCYANWGNGDTGCNSQIPGFPIHDISVNPPIRWAQLNTLDGSGNGRSIEYMNDAKQGSTGNLNPTSAQANSYAVMLSFSCCDFPVTHDMYVYSIKIFTRASCNYPTDTQCLGPVVN